jgi:hypothetical protein
LVHDFAQDIRRFAARIKMKKELCDDTKELITVSIGNKIHFAQLGKEDKKAEVSLRACLGEVESLEEADENAVI